MHGTTREADGGFPSIRRRRSPPLLEGRAAAQAELPIGEAFLSNGRAES